MTDQGTQTGQAEPSPAEKLAQPVAPELEPQQATSNESSGDKPSAKKTSIKSEGVPVAKLSGIGVPVAVVLFILAFLWKGPVFAVGVLAAIALALAVIWAVRTVAARPPARNTRNSTREPRSPRNPRAPRSPGAPPRSPRGGDRGSGRDSRQNGDRSRFRPWKRRQNNDTKPPRGDDRRKPPAKPDGKPPSKPPIKDSPKGRQPATTSPKGSAPGGKPGPAGPGRNGQPGKSGNQPAGSKTPGKSTTKQPQGATTKPPGTKTGSSPSRTDGGKTRGSQPPKPAQLVKNVDPSAPSRSKDKPGDGSRGRGFADRNRDRGGNDRGNSDGTAKPGKPGEKTTTGTKKPKGKEEAKPKKTVEPSAPPRRGPVNPRLQWVVNPDAAQVAPTDPKIQALADKVRVAGGATPNAPGVASLEEKRQRNLGEAIRKAGETPAQSPRPLPIPVSTKRNDERFNSVYGHMIDVSSPERKAASLERVAEKAKKDQRRLLDEADELRSRAAGLPEYSTYDEERSELLARATEVEEDAERRGHWATASSERAEEFAAQRERLTL